MTNPYIDQDPLKQKKLNTEPSNGDPLLVAEKEINISKRTRLAVAAGAGVVALAAIFGWVAKGVADDARGLVNSHGTDNSDKPFPGSYNGEDTTIYIQGDTDKDGALSKSEIQALDPIVDREAVKSVDVKSLLSAYASDLDSWRADTYAIMERRYMNDAQKDVVSVPIEQDKRLYSDQDVINSITIDLADMSVQTKNPTEGQRMLPLILDRNSAGFDEFYNKITDPSIIIDVNKHTGKQIPKPTGSFMGHDLSDVADARVIEWENVPGDYEPDATNFTRYALYVLNEKNGESSWQLINKWSPDQPGLQEAIDALNG